MRNESEIMFTTKVKFLIGVIIRGWSFRMMISTLLPTGSMLFLLQETSPKLFLTAPFSFLYSKSGL